MVNYKDASTLDGQSKQNGRNFPYSSPLFHLKVFYLRVDNCEIDESIPDRLTVNYTPLSQTILEVNGRKSSIQLDYYSLFLRRDVLNKAPSEATFVSTDCIGMTGSMKYEVYDKDNLLLFGVLELSDMNDFSEEAKMYNRNWNMECKSSMSADKSFLRSKLYLNEDVTMPTLEVYVAGTFKGKPIVWTKALHPFSLKQSVKMAGTISSPEDEMTFSKKEEQFLEVLQPSENEHLSTKLDSELNHDDFYNMAEYLEEDDGELSWFNAGVRVGVSIGLGICLGVGIAAGMLISTYQTTNRKFKRRCV